MRAQSRMMTLYQSISRGTQNERLARTPTKYSVSEGRKGK